MPAAPTSAEIEAALGYEPCVFRRFFEASSVGMAMAGPDQRFMKVNQAFCQMLGYDEHELIGRTYADFTYRDDLPDSEEHARRLYQGVAKDSYQKRYVHRNGGIRWAQVTLTSVTDESGSSTYALAVVEDITERRRIEELLRKNEARLAEAQALALVGSWEWDLVTGESYWSDELYRIYGLAAERPPTVERFLDCVHQLDRERLRRLTPVASSDPQPFDTSFRIVRPDGLVRVLHSKRTVIRGASGRPVRLIGVEQDITERVGAEEALRESEDRYRDLVEHSEDLICTHDLEGRVLSLNEAPARILGYERSELLLRLIPDMLAPETREKFGEYMAVIRRDGEARGLVMVQARTGEKRTWEYRNTLRTEGVAAPIVRGMAHDITERKRAEQERRASEERYRTLATRLMTVRDEERRSLARELHDETGQTLTSLLVGLRTIEDARTAREARSLAKQLRRIASEAVDDLGRIARGLHPSVLDDHGLDAALRRLAGDMAEVHGISIAVEDPCLGDERFPPLLETALYRITQEALANAVRHAHAQHVLVSARCGDGEIVLRVRDDGPGLDPANPGTEGHLGLLGMRERAALAAGTVAIESRPGEGTTVVARLPLGDP